jgi:hypothetical protein
MVIYIDSDDAIYNDDAADGDEMRYWQDEANDNAGNGDDNNNDDDNDNSRIQ